MFPKAPNKQRGGASMSFPDVCKVPAPPAPFAPAPMPNIQIASSNLSKAAKKVKIMGKKIEDKSSSSKSSKGDEAGSLKGVTSKMMGMFATHAAKVKVTGKKASRIMMPKQANRMYQQAQKQQKAFEKQLQKECAKLKEACKDNPDQAKLAKKLIQMVEKAARGHAV